MNPGPKRANPDTDDDPSRFDRPQRRSRPRTKDRPAHDDAEDAIVIAVDRGRYACRLADPDTGRPGSHEITAMKARQLGRRAVVLGDRVRIVGDTSGAEGSLARIVEVAERATVLRRTADDNDPYERIIVANAEQLVVVVALADPAPRSRLVDRCLVAAYDGGLTPLLCLTKTDLADPSEFLQTYTSLDVPYVAVRRDQPLDALSAHLDRRVSVLVGHSGVGKSTLVNALVPGATRSIGAVNAVTGRGRQTSTSAVALPLPDGGWVIDTPGIRSFGLAHVSPERVVEAFDDLASAVKDCPRGCTHAASEPECALDEAVRTGRLDAERVESFRRLLTSRDSDP